jgi:hypothetical protein
MQSAVVVGSSWLISVIRSSPALQGQQMVTHGVALHVSDTSVSTLILNSMKASRKLKSSAHSHSQRQIPLASRAQVILVQAGMLHLR